MIKYFYLYQPFIDLSHCLPGHNFRPSPNNFYVSAVVSEWAIDSSMPISKIVLSHSFHAHTRYQHIQRFSLGIILSSGWLSNELFFIFIFLRLLTHVISLLLNCRVTSEKASQLKLTPILFLRQHFLSCDYKPFAKSNHALWSTAVLQLMTRDRPFREALTFWGYREGLPT